jgi:hypothetical protein
MPTPKQQMSAGAAYQAHIKEKAPEIVDVTAPSGFVFKFQKPSRYEFLTAMDQLPMSATSKAIEAWQKDGQIQDSGSDGDALDATHLANAGLMVMARMLELSQTPKLIIGTPQNDNELSLGQMDEKDVDYLLQWTAKGGDTSAMLGNFPGGSQPNVMASASRKKQRHKSEPVSGNR